MTENKPLLVGITGGIGSGKTTICRIFSILGIPIYEADSRARWLMNHDLLLKQEIIQHFGAESYDQAGLLNRAYLAAQVFSQEEKVKLINALVHPRVGEDFSYWVQDHKKAPYLLNEAALMFESGRYLQLDRVITVFAPIDLRIRRIQSRDAHRSPEEIQAIISKQMPEEEKMNKAHHILFNDEKQAVLPQVLQLHQSFLVLSQKSQTN